MILIASISYLKKSKGYPRSASWEIELAGPIDGLASVTLHALHRCKYGGIGVVLNWLFTIVIKELFSPNSGNFFHVSRICCWQLAGNVHRTSSWSWFHIWGRWKKRYHDRFKFKFNSPYSTMNMTWEDVHLKKRLNLILTTFLVTRSENL